MCQKAVFRHDWRIPGSKPSRVQTGQLTSLHNTFSGHYERGCVSCLMARSVTPQTVTCEAGHIWIACLPIKIRVHRIGINLLHPWATGYVRHLIALEFWCNGDTARINEK